MWVLSKQWCGRGAPQEGPRTEIQQRQLPPRLVRITSGHGGSTLLFSGVLRGQARLLRVRTISTKPPRCAGLQGPTSPRALVPQALLPGTACRDGPSALGGRGGSTARPPGCPHSPARTAGASSKTRRTPDTTEGFCPSSPAAVKASRAVPEETTAWLTPGTSQVLLGSAGRQQYSPFHQR